MAAAGTIFQQKDMARSDVALTTKKGKREGEWSSIISNISVSLSL